MSRAAWAVAVVAAVGCRAEPPADWRAGVDAFRTAYEAILVGPAGPRTAIAGYYVGTDDTLWLKIVDGAPARVPSEDAATLSIVVDESGMHCRRGCGDGPVDVASMVEADLGDHHVVLSPQSGSLRVVVHGPTPVGPPVRWFAPDPAFWVQASLDRTSDAAPQTLATTRGLTKPMTPVGTLSFSLEGEATRLTAYDAGEGKIMIPFTDPTNDEATYAVGRYLEAELGDGPVALDFNRATNPWCAYSEHYNCPVPPADNAVPVPVRAGEMRPH